jgi:methylthioxylose transferase
VLMTSKEVAGERFARGAAPFLIFAPTALFWSSGDAVFLGIGAWAVCFVILATGRTDGRGDLLATAGGTLAALGLFSSYGLLLLGLVPLAVAVQRRRVRPILLAALPIVLMLAGAAAAGFWWFDGLAATRREYAESIARVRPYWYFVAANIAALAVALGPATLVALSRLRDRKAWLLVGGALGAVAIADLSGLSKAEVERIWLPFMPWIVVAAGAAFASARPRRGWLGAQIGWTLLVQLVVLSPW